MSDSTAIFRQACLAKVTDQILNQVLLKRLTATLSKVTRISWKEMLVYYRWNWCWLSWQISGLTFACEHVQFEWLCLLHPANEAGIFINQLNFRPSSVRKLNSMGHLLPCAIDFKTNHPSIHFQRIGILGMATEPHHVISMGHHQTEVRGDTIVCCDI